MTPRAAIRRWRLPEGVDELLPPAARQLELMRRRVLDVFHAWGFEYVEPPVIEYLDSLLVGSGTDLDLQTLKAVDQRTGRLLGVRADMTSQAARIDAHSLPGDGVQRLCYAGPVVHANPAAALDTRVPYKAGAEIFGAASAAADAEVVALMLEVLRQGGVERPVLVLGHMGIFQALTASMSLSVEMEQALFSAVQSKSETDVRELLCDRPGAELVASLPALMGRRDVLDEARRTLAGAPAEAGRAIDALEALADMVVARVPGVTLRFDIAELAGYGYHNGPVFSAFQAERGSALARGGRYDGIGAAFGRARPATGFDVSLKALLAAEASASAGAVWVPWVAGDGDRRRDLQATLAGLRAAGDVVICALSADEAPPARCDRMISETGDGWTVQPLPANSQED
ncbi:MAG: ATP phosphoribosyltransferase regulatory subunit [Gammaproteobacteria bacterium]|nr:ATP phosphoribosyltransferase regulatory subunit [Gammaproteobacteria bacterium]MBK80586.1 ATP phosphoribosyltransferase regulatory subunit [Gammaproteobacteria bacterium]